MRLITGRCPSCKADMRGAEIPLRSRPAFGGKTHFSRIIAVQYGYDSPEHYDGVSEWQCPDCGYREGRWSGRALRRGEVERRFGGEGAVRIGEAA